MRYRPLAIFAIALVPRMFLWWARIQFGYQVSPPGTLTLLSDFTTFYVKQLAYLTQGFLPYQNIPYSSPPLFLYSLYPFYLAGGVSLAPLPIVTSDAFSSVLIYKIAEGFSGSRIGTFAAIAYALSPIALFFEGFLWFNSQPVVLFALLSVYLLQTKRFTLASIALGVAVLFKQDALFIAPAFFIWSLTRNEGGRLKPIASFFGTLVAGSLPFLILTPISYIKAVSYGFLGTYSATLSLTQIGNQSSTVSSLVTSPTCSYTANLSKVVETCTNAGAITITSHGQNLEAVLTILGDSLGPVLIISLAILLFPAILVTRKWPNSYLLSSVYSSILFLIVFSFEVHSIYRYYLLLPYALLLAGSTNWRTLAVPVLSMGLSVYLPEGNFQLILLLSALLAFIALQDSTPPPSYAVERKSKTLNQGYSNSGN